MPAIKAGNFLGQYRVRRRLESGGFADVYEAYDTIEGIRVALKIPHAENINQESLDLFRNEVRLTARLDHPNILPIKHAGFIDERFIIVYPLGKGSLEDRLKSRISVHAALNLAQQALEAVACAHRRKVMHMDLKPANFILFEGGRMRLADFGLARIAQYTLAGSGSGTIGYISPEQAMGKPTLRSDVFSLGLILYRLFSGKLPEWPYEWPPIGYSKIKKTLPPLLLDLISRAISVDQKKRPKDAAQMLAVFKRTKTKITRTVGRQRSTRRRRTAQGGEIKAFRIKLFQQRYRAVLDTRHICRKCRGPVSEAMRACPWCAAPRKKHGDDVLFPAQCPRCKRGRKLDWKFCAWCYGPGLKKLSERRFSDTRYSARCGQCKENTLMPFSHYCPLCRTKVKKKWPIRKSEDRCPRCRWSVLKEFWRACPWCAKALG